MSHADEEHGFAHQSEFEFAKMLDRYGVEWEYEPRSFAIEFDEAGDPTKFFTPDFYLPATDQYVETTTMRQKLVTKKNRKLRLLQENHPEIRCRIFYRRDFQELQAEHKLPKWQAVAGETIHQGYPPERLPGPPRVTMLEGSAPNKAAIRASQQRCSAPGELE